MSETSAACFQPGEAVARALLQPGFIGRTSETVIPITASEGRDLARDERPKGGEITPGWPEMSLPDNRIHWSHVGLTQSQPCCWTSRTIQTPDHRCKGGRMSEGTTWETTMRDEEDVNLRMDQLRDTMKNAGVPTVPGSVRIP